MKNENLKLKIIFYPDPILRKKIKAVRNINSEETQKIIQGIIKKMKIVIKEAGGVGLAANQIGKDARIFIVYLENKFYTFINPEIIKSSKQKITMEEACLSVPGIYGIVERPEKVVIIAQNENAAKIKKSARGLFARVIQHEIDHLNGILFIDKAKCVQKIEFGK